MLSSDGDTSQLGLTFLPIQSHSDVPQLVLYAASCFLYTHVPGISLSAVGSLSCVCLPSDLFASY